LVAAAAALTSVQQRCKREDQMVEILLLWDRLHMVVAVVLCGTESQRVGQVLQLAAVVPQQVEQVLLAHHLFLPRKVLQVEQEIKIGHTVIKLEVVEVLVAPGVMAQHLEIRVQLVTAAPAKLQRLREHFTVAVVAVDVTEMEVLELALMVLE
jgi:hypothetical protein